ncbi:MAG: hypothetical protein ACRC4L_02625 [Mycoplasma sp.]
MDKKVCLKIFTPDGLVFDKNIDSISLKTSSGIIGLCANQPRSLMQVETDIAKITINNDSELWLLCNGIIQITPKLITISNSCSLQKNNESKLLIKKNILKLEEMSKITKDNNAIEAIKQQLEIENTKLNLLSK